MARMCITLQNAQKKRPPGKHPTQKFVRQQFMMNENNEILHDKEEEDSNKHPHLKEAAETQQPSPQPNIEQHAITKPIENAVSIASVMEEIHKEVETDTPL